MDQVETKVTVASDPDNVKGITILPSGTRLFWAEGCNGYVIVPPLPNKETIDSLVYFRDHGKQHPAVVECEQLIMEGARAGTILSRPMTAEEEAEYSELYDG